MKRLFLIVVIMLLAMTNAEAQSKKELKAQAKRQELIAATTNDDGSRYFEMDKRLPHIGIKVRDCHISENTIKVNLLISNSNSNDDLLNLTGDYCSWRDVNNVYRCCNNMGFAIGDSNDFQENLYEVTIPGGGVLKVSMIISNVDANTAIVNNLNIAVNSKILSRTYKSPDGSTVMRSYFNNVYYLNVNR